MSVLRQLRTEAHRTLSPNSGWPMAALALSLNVRLRKPNVYALNAEGLEPSAMKVSIALRRVEASAWLAAAVFTFAILYCDGIGYAGY
jgi:adenosylcobinamide-phosphate synthase